MIKLFKNINGQTHYWETWDADKSTAVIHWGIIGNHGESKEIKSRLFSSNSKFVQQEINEKLEEGYSEIDEDDWSFLEIEYKIEGFGSDLDLEKRHKLEGLLDEVLGWNGLGHVDGGSIGSGTMEVGCMVVDFNVAKKVIEENLKDTIFSNYTRIFELEGENEA